MSGSHAAALVRGALGRLAGPERRVRPVGALAEPARHVLHGAVRAHRTTVAVRLRARGLVAQALLLLALVTLGSRSMAARRGSPRGSRRTRSARVRTGPGVVLP